MTFEESAEELAQNLRSLGFDLDKLVRQKKIAHRPRPHRAQRDPGDRRVRPRGPVHPPGPRDRTVGAKRVVLDTIEALFAGLPNHAMLRAELRRLFRWLKDRGVTAVITGERGEDSLTRYGLEEYVADCVILLDHRIDRPGLDAAAARRQVPRHEHGTNEYPFLIGEDGISVLPITSMRLDHEALTERVSTGIAGLDEMLGGKGVYRGSSSPDLGRAGHRQEQPGRAFRRRGLPARRAGAAVRLRGVASQVLRNMRSIGLDLEPWCRKGLLRFHAARSTTYRLGDASRATFHKLVEDDAA